MAGASFGEDTDRLVTCERQISLESIAMMNDVEVDEEEIRQVQKAFTNMIDQTCSKDSNIDEFPSEYVYGPRSSLAFLFNSMVPKQDTIRQSFSSHLFNYEDRDNMKYAFQVLDRRTNRLIYEQMPTYHKYAMRLLFSGPVQCELLDTSTIRNFFARETIRLGEAFDEPKSRKHIPSFVKMYQINLEELLQPNLSKYFTFNEFFYRQLKPNARPIDQQQNPSIIVSAADCRLIVFDEIYQATQIWIKGQQFSLRSLFDNEELAKEFDGGSIAVFRLAPDDYHRFHSPICGVIGQQMKQITGTYYTVNPIAIKGRIDVLTRNQRTVITIESDLFEKIVFVAVGALLVGSVNFTVKPNQTVKKGDELGKKQTMNFIARIQFSNDLGYFAYGGSTVVAVFKAGMVEWDEDLRHNSNNAMETLVRMGEHIGQRTSDKQREEYLLNNQRNNTKNGTVSQLLMNFPVMNPSK